MITRYIKGDINGTLLAKIDPELILEEMRSIK